MTGPHSTGELGLEYATGRGSKMSLRYRRKRRTREVVRAIKSFLPASPSAIIDLGTAEGRMLESLHREFPSAECAGIEYNAGLAELGRRMFPHLNIMQGDVQDLEFEDGSFDTAVATAVIEHVPDKKRLLSETRRILRPGGIIVLTCPAPFWEKLATAVGHLPREQHSHVPSLRELADLAHGCGFDVLEKQRFMLSPVGLPFEPVIEAAVRSIRCDFLMANQLLVARR
jgi:trans-aconitate methyltransferase